MEGFQNRSQTKSKAFFIVVFLIIGTFLVFKLTQDGSKYASPFSSPTNEVKVSQNPVQTNNTDPKTTDETPKILKLLIDNIVNFNQTFLKLDESLRNFTNNIANGSNWTLPTEGVLDWGLGDYNNMRKDLLFNLGDLKKKLEAATNGTK